MVCLREAKLTVCSQCPWDEQRKACPSSTFHALTQLRDAFSEGPRPRGQHSAVLDPACPGPASTSQALCQVPRGGQRVLGKGATIYRIDPTTCQEPGLSNSTLVATQM